MWRALPRGVPPIADTLVEAKDIERVSLFAPLSARAHLRLAQEMHIRHYRKGMLLFLQGERCDTLYVVLAGHVRIYQTLDDGREYTLEHLGADEVLAAVCFFDGGPYPASAEAMSDCSVATLNYRALQLLMRNEPEMPLAFLRVLSGRLRRAHHRSTELALQTVHERLASTLLRLVDEQIAVERRTSTSGAGSVWAVPVRATELGRTIGAARETVTRALHDFERQGAIRLKSGRLSILDLDKLRTWCTPHA